MRRREFFLVSVLMVARRVPSIIPGIAMAFVDLLVEGVAELVSARHGIPPGQGGFQTIAGVLVSKSERHQYLGTNDSFQPNWFTASGAACEALADYNSRKGLSRD